MDHKNSKTLRISLDGLGDTYLLRINNSHSNIASAFNALYMRHKLWFLLRCMNGYVVRLAHSERQNMGRLERYKVAVFIWMAAVDIHCDGNRCGVMKPPS